MSAYDRQKDIEAEGQRAAIYHGKREKGGVNRSFQIVERPPAPAPTKRPMDEVYTRLSGVLGLPLEPKHWEYEFLRQSWEYLGGFYMRIDLKEVHALFALIKPQLEVMGTEWSRQVLRDFKVMKVYGIDMLSMEMRDGALVGVVTEEFLQHLRANGIDI